MTDVGRMVAPAVLYGDGTAAADERRPKSVILGLCRPEDDASLRRKRFELAVVVNDGEVDEEGSSFRSVAELASDS